LTFLAPSVMLLNNHKQKQTKNEKKERTLSMSYNNTVVEKYQGVLPKNKFWKFNKIIRQNNVIDVTRMTWEPECQIKRLTKRFYLHIKTGEVKEVMPKIEGVHFRNVRSLKKIFRDLRQLITTNFEGSDCEQFLTLTYSEQHNDPKKIYKDLEIFNKRLKRAYPNIGYIHIVEPHGSGNFHIHSLLKDTTGKKLDLDFVKVYELWSRRGWCTVENLNNVDNIGAYFIAYFSNMEIAEEDSHKYPDDIKEVNGKKFIKGKRLDFYPDNMYIYRNSRNLKKPEAVGEIDDIYNKTYDVTYKLTSTDNDGNTSELYINKEQHKRQGKASRE